MKQITLRQATINDAPAIAEVIHCAIGDEAVSKDYCGDDYLAVLADVARAENTQYSWRNAIIAECEGKVVGGVVGYDGAQLRPLREGTLSVIRSRVGRVPDIVDETESGEYYLDSVAVFPGYRGMGIARRLIAAFCDRAYAGGAERVGLIVDIDNPMAASLYASVGFESVGERMFFGHRMRHMQRVNRSIE